MEIDLEKEKSRFCGKVNKNCTWVFDTDLCVKRDGVACYSVSLNDKEMLDNQFVVSVYVPDLKTAFEVLESVATVGGSVVNGLGQSYNSLVKNGSEAFVLNVYNYLHTDLAENHL